MPWLSTPSSLVTNALIGRSIPGVRPIDHTHSVAYVGGEGIALSGPTPDEALLAALRSAANAPELRFVVPPERMTGGLWAEIVAVRVEGGPPDLDGDLVVRIMPD